MQRVERRAFWLSFGIFFLFFGYLVVFGSKLWRLSLPLQVGGVCVALAVLVGWLVWRGGRLGVHLPRTGMEWGFGLGVLALGLSLAFSPDASQGSYRAAWLVGYLVIFYLMLDGLDGGLDRWGALTALLANSGILLILALFETFQWYSQYWQMVGQFGAAPPEPYRFFGLLNAPGPLMAMADMCFPLAVLALIRFRKPIVRVLLIYWLLVFFLAIPFSSSRGGWLALAVTVAVGLGLLTWEKKLWHVVLSWSRRKQILAGVGIVAGLALLALAGLVFLKLFASQASHGGNPFGVSGRDLIWRNALSIWEKNPILGAGPGRFGVAYRQTEFGSSPAWWAGHAHNVFLQILAEFGAVGFLAGLALILTGMWRMWGWYRTSTPALRVWNGAVVASLVGLLVHLIFDEFTGWPSVMVGVAFLVAWVATGGGKPFPRYERSSFRWVWLPGLALCGLAAWGVYTFQPMIDWAKAAQGPQGYRASAELIHQSVERDPGNSFYTASEAIAWAMAWGRTQDASDLARARAAFKLTLAQEPGYANLWANLAVLDWYSGNRDIAMEHMDTAIQLAPRDYSFVLNRGWFKELRGDAAGAAADYRQALMLDPTRANHPFWQGTPLRKQVLQSWRAASPSQAEAGSYWQDALADIQRGDLDSAQQNLARSGVMNESFLARVVVQGKILEGRGQPDEALEVYARLIELMALPVPYFDYGNFYLGIATVPGLLQLEPDEGQFEALQKLFAAYRSRGDCDRAAQAWETLTRASAGGALGVLTPMPECK